METFPNVPGLVFHIEEDIDNPGSLLFSTEYGFYTVNVHSTPPTPQVIAGREGTFGYVEGRGKSIQSSPYNELVRERLRTAEITVITPWSAGICTVIIHL